MTAATTRELTATGEPPTRQLRPWSGWRAVRRVAWRDVHRHRGRTVLVAAMIAVPVAATTAVDTVVRSLQLPPAEVATRTFGRADVLAGPWPTGGVDGTTAEDTFARVRALLPEGSAVVAVDHARVGQPVGGTYRWVEVTTVPLDGVTAGVLALRAGRGPVAADEVALSPTLLDDLGATIGSEVTLWFGTYRVVGSVVLPDDTRSRLGVLAPGSAIPPLPAADIGTPSTRRWYVDLPADPDLSLWRSLSEARARIRGPDASRGGPSGSAEWRFARLVGQALGLLVTGIVVAAALAVGTRRCLRDHGLLLAQGAAPGQLAAVVVGYGALCGLIGGIGGVAVASGAVTVVFASGLMAQWSGRIPGPVQWNLGGAVVAVLLGTVAAALAAWAPARHAAGTPVLVSLAGRRPLSPVPVRVPLRGMALGVTGVVVLWLGDADQRWPVVAVGGALMMLACVVCAPALVALLEHRPRACPALLRLAWRDLARHRSRVAPVVAAITVAAGVFLCGSTLVSSDRARHHSAPAVRWTGVDTAVAADRVLLLVALGITALSVLAVVAIGLALTTSEGRPDLATLSALGAGPSTHRRIVGLQAWTMTTLGTAMAVPVGVLPAAVAWRSRDEAPSLGDTVAVPWLPVLAVVVLLPVVAGVLAACCTRGVPARPPECRL